MERNFNIKNIKCSPDIIYEKIQELETEWLTSLLIRATVPKMILKKVLDDSKYSSERWREYLFDEKGITITKDMANKKVSVFQLSFETEKQIKIGEWSFPSIIRMKEDKNLCELELKYWQII